MRTVEIYDNLVSQFEKGIADNNSKMIQDFLNSTRVESLKESPDQYTVIKELRAKAYTLFGKFMDADVEYKEGLEYCLEAQRCEYMVNWALSNLTLLSITNDPKEYVPTLRLGLKLLDEAEKYAANYVSEEYALLTLANVKAFFLILINENELAKTCYSECLFTPVPVDVYNDKDAMQMVFANYFKGLSVAIELKDKELLMNLMKVISIDDGVLYGDHGLFKKFYVMMMDAFDSRSEFGSEFDNIFRLMNKVEGAYPNLKEFMKLIGKPDFENLEKMFSSFK